MVKYKIIYQEPAILVTLYVIELKISVKMNELIGNIAIVMILYLLKQILRRKIIKL